MEKFKISDIQEIFVSDVERFHRLTEEHVSRLLNEATPAQESLDEALRQCHTLKGLAGTVEAWGLSCLGADLERLLELAGSWVQSDRARANEVFEFILDHMQDWYVMNQFTCLEMLPQAWDVYRGLRAIMEERWPGCLPEPVSAAGTDEQYVRLTELEISEVATGIESPVAEAQSATVADGELKEDLDVRGAQVRAARANEGAVAQSGAPLPVRVVPPTLRRAKDKSKSDEPSENQSAIAKVTESGGEKNLDAAPGEVIARAEQPATPKPLQVVPPTLRRRDAAATSKETNVPEPTAPVAGADVESVSAASVPPAELPATVVPTTNEVTPAVPPLLAQTELPVAPVEGPAAVTPPPLLRVAPPALKRRGKVRAARADAKDAADASALPEKSAEQLPVQPLEVEPAAAESAVVPIAPVEPVSAEAAEALSAEAIFAALPEPVEAGAALVSAESAAPAVSEQKDLLELLSQEVAGYLVDLATSLSALAGDLTAEAPWEQTRRLFHTIKGTAATFGLDTVSAPAKAAEARCIVAVEDVTARTGEAFESCVHRAAVVARSLQLKFDEGRLHEALRVAQADAANVVALRAAEAHAPVASLDAEMAGFFINDTRDQIGIIEQAVLRWEKGEQPTEQVNAAQRGFHTIKGAGNSIGLTAVAQSVHEVEAFLEDLAGKGAKGSKAIFTFLLGAVDQLRQYLVALTRNTASPWRHDWSVTIGGLSSLASGAAQHQVPNLEAASAHTAEVGAQLPTAAVLSVGSSAEVGDVSSDESVNTLRIEAARLYQLMNLISEMVIDRARLARKIDQLAGLHRALAERHGALTGSVLNFQQQFEFNLAAGATRRGEDGGLRLEDGAGKGGASLLSSMFHAPASASASGGHGEFSELEFDRYDQFNVLARSLVEISHDIEVLNGEVAVCLDSFAAENVQFTQTSQELQAQVTGLGLVPVNTLFPRLQRAFRDACSVEGKAADLVLGGGETLLDKVVVDKVYAPLLHLLRNAVAHGIEAEGLRLERKKAARGVVRLSATQLSNQIVWVLSDDGAGVDAAAVRERAIAKGWLDKAAPELSTEQVVEFIFRPGFSTAAKVTSVSGRGIGLDVVRREVEHLNGSVELRYEAGAGATWTLRVPLTLSISEAILAEVGGRQFAFPLNFIEAGLILESELRKTERGVELYPVERRNVEAQVEGEGAPAEGVESGPQFDLLPVWRLSGLLGVAGNEGSNKGLLVGVGDRRVIVVVDGVLRRQEVVVKQLDVVMAQHALLNGATLDAEGRVIPILNLPTLLKLGDRLLGLGSGVTQDPKSETREPRAKTRVLVVDDSLSVRKVQERFLRDLGCQVVVASDGLVALEKLREQEFDLVFTDLEMPRINGYELISELRGNPVWSELPVVVISSRGADKYITKAMNLGASTFLSKPFTQEQLRQVLGHYAKG